MTVVLEREGMERFLTRIKADQDPTSSVPEFAFTTGDERPDTWVDGAWDDESTQGNDSTTWSAVAMSPLIGYTGSGAPVELTSGTPTPWVRITVGDEQFVRRLPNIVVRA